VIWLIILDYVHEMIIISQYGFYALQFQFFACVCDGVSVHMVNYAFDYGVPVDDVSHCVLSNLCMWGFRVC
jgi:hypothetical protein